MSIKDKIISRFHNRSAKFYSFIRKNYIHGLPPTLIKNEKIINKIKYAQITDFPREMQIELKFALDYQKEIETLFNHDKLNHIFNLLLSTESINGDIIELGTYKGGSTIMMARFLKRIKSNRHILTFDTFEGFPYEETGSVKTIKTSSGAIKNKMDMFKDTSLEKVESKFKTFQVSDIIKTFKGSFNDTLPKLTDEKFSFALVDCDIYDSVCVSMRSGLE